MKRIKLYDYQQDMLEKVIQVLTDKKADTIRVGGKKIRVGNSALVQMPTGTGKTIVMGAVVKWFLDTYDKGEVWIVAHRRELVEQMQQTLERFCLNYGEKNMVLKAKVRIRVMSIQWLNRNLEKMQCEPGLIVVDEAHHALARTYQNVFEVYRSALKLGMTATPCRMKKESFTGIFSKLIFSPSTQTFIHLGYLSSYDYVCIGKFSPDQLTINLLKGRGSDGDYAIKEMDEKLNIPQTILRLYQSVKKYAEGRRGIVYAIDIDHARAIAECYNTLGVKSVALDSKTPSKTRERMVSAFRNGELDCLVNVNLFDEGFDCPDVEFIQMARPTLSLAKYLQMVGRGLRINRTNKDKVCMIIDNVGNYRKFGLPDKPREWVKMFTGLRDGKGVIPSYVKKLANIVTVEDEMVVVKKADENLPRMSALQRSRYLRRVRPFMDKMLFGLRVDDDEILPPIYSYISDFMGDYAVFQQSGKYYGLLDRSGKIILKPNYKQIKLLSAHTVMVTKVNMSQETITLE